MTHLRRCHFIYECYIDFKHRMSAERLQVDVKSVKKNAIVEIATEKTSINASRKTNPRLNH